MTSSPRPMVGRESAWAHWPATQWFALLGLVLAGLALFDKGFAYIGSPPMFIGEVTVALGVAVFFTLRGWREVLTLGPVRWLVVLLVWGAMRTVPYLGQHGITALRDAVLVGYGVLAIVVAGVIIEKPTRLGTLVRWYGHLSIVLVVGLLPLWALGKMWMGDVPTWPWADTPILDVKSGDSLVHFAGIFAFWASGLGAPALWQMLLLAAGVGAIGTSNRGGLVTFLMVAAGCFALRPRAPAFRGLVAVGVGLLVLLAATNISFATPDDARKISARQLLLNLTSIVSNQTTDAGALQGTKAWRLNWWGDILDYTVYGKYFWTGKGFGVNLANSDGYQTDTQDASLRSPHNGHMNILARMGVPGLVLWFGVHGAWAWLIGKSLMLARARAEHQWSGLFLFLGAYWLAFLINASFDVFLEGPMGGIWFWAVTGTGLAAAWCYRHAPEALNQPTEKFQPAVSWREK